VNGDDAGETAGFPRGPPSELRENLSTNLEGWAMSHRALWLLPAAALAVALVFVIALALGWGERKRTTGPPRAFKATASLSSRAISFGDPLTARLDLLVDPAAVDPAGIQVHPRFGLFRVTGTSLERTRGDGELLSYRFALECLGAGCAPESDRVTRRLPPATVTYRTRDGANMSENVPWPSYQLTSRVTAADRKNPANALRFDATLPAPTYRISAGLLRSLLTVLAVLLALAAAVLVWLALRPRSAVAEGPPGSRLEQALRAVRASSANGRPVDRRKALGWLGRELRSVERSEEADEAGRLAWSARTPTGEAAGDFATEVESSEADR
jgi:hypothetical protein